MKRTIALATALLVLALSRAAGAQHDEPEKAKLGAKVKDFALKDSGGADFKRPQGICVLTFWCTTCMSCRDMERDFEHQAKAYKDKGALFVMVASNHAETAQQVNDFLKKKSLGFPVLMDSQSELARYFGATVTTTTAVIDAEGCLRYYGAFWKAEQAVKDLIAGQPVTVAETRPNG